MTAFSILHGETLHEANVLAMRRVGPWRTEAQTRDVRTTKTPPLSSPIGSEPSTAQTVWVSSVRVLQQPPHPDLAHNWLALIGVRQCAPLDRACQEVANDGLRARQAR